ncbi:hypothetical protein OF83DRAFT_1086825 [Amylostereum chailletii]|nr:hypothetical protein OF83DRAFT_1086825 [Amylostereum chailletii]
MSVSTRTRTGKLPHTGKRNLSTISDGSDDSGSELEIEPKVKTRRPKKRVKKDDSRNTESSQPVARRKKGKLSNLPEMPLDILFDIFGHLAPGDLVRLARTTKPFRKLLLSATYDSMWAEAFNFVKGAPPVPKDTSPRKWAHLLYGGCYCSACGKSTTSKIMFMFRKRFCSKCLQTEIVSCRSIQAPLFFVRAGFCNAFDYLLPTMTPPKDCRTNLCDKSAAHALIREVTEKCADIKDSDKEGLRVVISSLVDLKKKQLSEHKNHVKICNEWQEETLKERKDELRDACNERRDKTYSIKRRFMEMGYTDQEWLESKVSSHKEVCVSRPLTEKVWTRILPILEPAMLEAREKQDAQGRTDRVLARRKAVLDLYAEIIQTLRPTEFPLIPSEDHCVDIPSIQTIIKTDIPEIGDDWRADAKKALEAALESAREAVVSRKRQLLALLPRLDGMPSDSIAINDDSLDALELATATFLAPASETRYSMQTKVAWFGADALASMPQETLFMSSEAPLSSIAFSKRLRETVQVILSMLGLDEKTTTAVQLDDMVVRFICNECRPTNFSVEGRAAFGHMTFRWRDMVDHVRKDHPAGERVDFFRVSTKEELTDILPFEKRITGKFAWGCCHCRMKRTGPRWMCEAEAIEHAKQKHAILQPLGNIDLFFNPRARNLGMSHGAVLENIQSLIIFFKNMSELTLTKTEEHPPDENRNMSMAPSQSDNSDNEMERKTQRTSMGRRPKKRAKKNAVPSQAVARGKRGKLGNLPDMPLNILFDIFEHLSPGDLVRLSRTTKAFKQLLSSAAYDSMWASSFQYTEGAPPRPEDMSPRGWAHLLFGGSYCNVCGKATTSKILFTFRKRFCAKCFQTQVVFCSSINVPEYLQGAIRGGLSSVLPTICGSKKDRRRKLCDKAAADGLFAELEEKCAELKDPDSRVGLVAAIGRVLGPRRTFAFGNERDEHVAICDQWQEKALKERKDGLQDASNTRKESIKKRLMEMGYTEEDWCAGGIADHKDVCVSRPLTEKAWSRILPTLELAIKEARDVQEALRKDNRIEERREAILELWTEILPTAHPMEFPFTPTPEICIELPPVKAFIDTDFKEIDDGWRAEAKKALQKGLEFAREAVVSHKRTLVALLPPLDATFQHPPPPPETRLYGPKVVMWFGADALASVSPQDLFLSAGSSLPNILFNERGRETVEIILSLLGLDKKTTTAVQLGRIGARFVCTKCDPTCFTLAGRDSGSYTYGHAAFPWRAMVCFLVFYGLSLVEHVYTVHHAEESLAGILRMLTKEEMADASPVEKSLVGKFAWGCCYCRIEDKRPHWMCEVEAVEHLKLKHEILDPKENVDLFFDPFHRNVGRPSYAVFTLPSASAENLFLYCSYGSFGCCLHKSV